MSRYRIGIDIGGTHTDFVVSSTDTTRKSYKVPTTPDDLFDGVRTGLLRAAEDHNQSLRAFLGETGLIVHGTTVTTNALIEGEQATTGLLTTDGFRDVLERNMKSSSELYELRRPPTTAPLPRYLRQGVPERIDSDGTVLEALDRAATRSAIESLVEDAAVEAIAVSLMSAYRNPVHEDEVAELVAEVDPTLACSRSHEVNPGIGLHDRSIASIVDASLQPILRSYLSRLEERLQAAGYEGRLLIMQGNGGVSSAALVAERPILSINSGPAAGAVSSGYHAALSGFDDVISFEMGGTSSDVCLIRNGTPLVGTDNQVGDVDVPVPMVAVDTIGAGGGSVGWVDDRGVLSVGPESAGSDPGPACYANGGERPTVTDANLVLGYLNPSYFLGGQMDLDLDAARRAIETAVAEPLGLSITEAAAGIRELAIEGILTQIRQVSIEAGHDVRDFGIVGAGGAGPLHVGALANRFEVPAIVPATAGTFSSVGLLEADIRHDFTRSIVEPLGERALSRVEEAFDEMEANAEQTVASEGAGVTGWSFDRTIETRYRGQIHELRIPVSEDDRIADVARSHHRQHERRYTFADEDATIEVVTARLTVNGTTQGTDDPHSREMESTGTIKHRREVYFVQTGETESTPIFDGSQPLTEPITGPAIVERPHTTVVIPPGTVATPDEYGILVLRPSERDGR